MRKLFLPLLSALLVLCITSCTNKDQKQQTNDETPQAVVLTTEQLRDMSFNDLFTSIEPTALKENIFKIFNEDYAVVTSGKAEDYNSMVASFGGVGILYGNPVTWLYLRANRYTLQYIRDNGSYTLCFFDEPYKEKIMHFGTSSGRGTDKMNTHSLTSTLTPAGWVGYKEARLIIECDLTQVTTVSPDDVFTQDGKAFVIEGYEDAGDYHKLVYGTISNIWVRK